MLIVGIDPGVHGGIVGINGHKEIQFLHVMPEDFMGVDRIFKELSRMKTPLMVYLEKAQAFPGNGAVSMFNYGCHFGELRGLLKSLGMPFKLISPSVWTRAIHEGINGAHSKEKSKNAVLKYFPGVCLRNPEMKKSRSMHTGLMDALLIAEFGRREMMEW